jgi:hypothetical protein
MISQLVEYDGQKLTTREFSGRLRGLTWDPQGTGLTLIGNGGRALSIQNNSANTLDTGTKHNLRAVSVNPVTKEVLAVGNGGTILGSNSDGSFHPLNSPTVENLRSVRWSSEGTKALIAGNNGTLVKYSEGRLDLVDDGRANLRGVSWRGETEALISSNCFAEEFIPSPNLFVFNAETSTMKPVNEGRIDLIGVDWNPNGRLAVAVGYDVVWHNGFIGRFDGENLSPIEFKNERVYPVTVRWDPTGRTAAIATSITQLHSGQGRLILWDGESLREIHRSEEFFFSQVAWAPVGFRLAAIASTEARTFDS